jgi:hypothetical protein
MNNRIPLDKYPDTNSLWRGDGLSGFREITVTDQFDGENVYFYPTGDGWTQMFLTYHLPLLVFHRIYSPCESHPRENSFSKIASPWPQPFFMSVARFYQAALARIRQLW